VAVPTSSHTAASEHPTVGGHVQREIESKVAWPREPEAGTLTACPPARGDGTKRATGVTKGPPTDRPTDDAKLSLSLSAAETRAGVVVY